MTNDERFIRNVAAAIEVQNSVARSLNAENDRLDAEITRADKPKDAIAITLKLVRSGLYKQPPSDK